MRGFTTPTIVLEVGADLTGCDAYLTLRQGYREMTITDFEDVSVSNGVTTLSVTLTQEQSARFADNRPIEAQVNVIDQAGYRVATDIATIAIDRQLMEREAQWQSPDLT